MVRRMHSLVGDLLSDGKACYMQPDKMASGELLAYEDVLFLVALAVLCTFDEQHKSRDNSKKLTRRSRGAPPTSKAGTRPRPTRRSCW